MLCLFCELVRDFPELIGYKLFAFRIGLDWLYIVAICIFKNTLAMIVISTEFSNRPTTPVPVIYIVVVELWLKHILEWTRDAYSVFDDIFFRGDTSDILMRFEPGPHCFETCWSLGQNFGCSLKGASCLECLLESKFTPDLR